MNDREEPVKDRGSKGLRAFVLGGFFIGSLVVALGQKIIWGNTAGDTIIDSGGNGIDSSYTIQLGSFVLDPGGSPSEFIPTDMNRAQWAEHWVPHDSAFYNQGGEGNEHTGFFSDSWVIDNNDYENFQAYIWVYNNLEGDSTSEWALITDLEGDDSWRIPTSEGGAQVFPEAWRVSTAQDVIFGGLNGVDGPGLNNPDTIAFALQLNTFASMPEPGPVTLCSLSFACFLLWRKRGISTLPDSR